MPKEELKKTLESYRKEYRAIKTQKEETDSIRESKKLYKELNRIYTEANSYVSCFSKNNPIKFGISCKSIVNSNDYLLNIVYNVLCEDMNIEEAYSEDIEKTKDSILGNLLARDFDEIKVECIR